MARCLDELAKNLNAALSASVDFSALVKLAQKHLDLDDLEMSRLLKVSRPTIGRWVRGESSTPHPLSRKAIFEDVQPSRLGLAPSPCVNDRYRVLSVLWSCERSSTRGHPLHVKFRIVDTDESERAFKWHLTFAESHEAIYPRDRSTFEKLIAERSVWCAVSPDGEYLAMSYAAFSDENYEWEIGGLMVSETMRGKSLGAS